MAGDYYDESYTRHLRDKIDKTQFQSDSRWNSVKKIHSFTQNNLTFREGDQDIWRPDYIWEHTREGNCQDVAAFLATLLDLVRIPFRIIVVDNPQTENTHVITQALLKAVPETNYRLHTDACEAKPGYWISVDPAQQGKPCELNPYLGRYVKPHNQSYYDLLSVKAKKLRR